MSALDPIRAWKDVEYRLSLDIHQRAMLPPHPAGEIELRDEDLEQLMTDPLATESRGQGCPPH